MFTELPEHRDLEGIEPGGKRLAVLTNRVRQARRRRSDTVAWHHPS
jgi:hypothetical protein